MTRNFSPDGVPTQHVADYYERRAKADVGLIITEGVAIPHKSAVDHPDVPHLFGHPALDGWSHVVQKVHQHGGKIFPQLWHQGPLWGLEHEGQDISSQSRPSGIWGPADGVISLDETVRQKGLPFTKAMTDSDIADVIIAYTKAARNAVQIGFDGIAIHGAHGYLIDSFLWGYTNRRTDIWGANVHDRPRLACEIVRSIRREIGDNIPIAFRFSQFKMQDYRATIAQNPMELEALLGPLADAGVDIFDASQRYFDTPAFPNSPLNLAGWAKKITGKFAMAVGGVGLGKSQNSAQHIDASQSSINNLNPLLNRMRQDEFDLIAVGRSLLNDPDWFRKVTTGIDATPFNPENLNRLT